MANLKPDPIRPNFNLLIFNDYDLLGLGLIRSQNYKKPNRNITITLKTSERGNTRFGEGFPERFTEKFTENLGANHATTGDHY